MIFDPLAVASVPADDQWDETLDVLAQAAAREMGERGLLRERAEDSVRYHFRGFARRLVYPLLDRVHAEIQTSQQEAVALRHENTLLRVHLAELERARYGRVRSAIVFGSIWTLLVLMLGALLYGAWSGPPRETTVRPLVESAAAPAPVPP
jgi:hypothetical protein